MIKDIAELTVGQKVHYQPSHFDEDEFENGIIKEIREGITIGVGVVYNCGGNWKEYKNYTSALTNLRDLKPGWKFREIEEI